MSAKERAELIEQLDPDRDYGDLSYTDLVHEVETNEIKIFPGITVPVLRDAWATLGGLNFGLVDPVQTPQRGFDRLDAADQQRAKPLTR